MMLSGSGGLRFSAKFDESHFVGRKQALGKDGVCWGWWSSNKLCFKFQSGRRLLIMRSISDS